MDKEVDKNKKYWNELSNYGVDASVIDPNDKIGMKNRYIIQNRNKYLSRALENTGDDALLLDFGCGSGNISNFLSSKGFRTVGVDIAFDLLALNNRKSNLVCYDGMTLPFKNETFSAAVSYVVLNHLLDDGYLLSMLHEIHRLLKPGASFIAIEQISHRDRFTDAGMKKQRSRTNYIGLFSEAGFTVESVKSVRAGHFPLIYLIRLGLVPRCLFQVVAGIDKLYSSIISHLPVDYYDTVFVLKKSN